MVKRMLFASILAIACLSLVLIAEETKKETQIQEPAKNSGLQRIVFPRGEELKAELYLWENGKETRLTDNNELECYQAFSPDGKKIAYCSSINKGINDWKSYEIWVMDADGKNKLKLATGISPMWSADSQKILFGNGEEKISVINADGKNETVLLKDKEFNYGHPKWSPDNKKIAFDSGKSGREEIYVADADGKNITQITKNPAQHIYSFAWSPDGRKIAFGAGHGPYHWDIYTISADGKDLTKVTPKIFSHGTFTWSPDGKKIACSLSNSTGGIEYTVSDLHGLYILGADGKTQQKLSDNVESSLSPQFSPDGKWIVYVSGADEISIISSDGKTKETLVKMSIGQGSNAIAFAPDFYWQTIKSK